MKIELPPSLEAALDPALRAQVLSGIGPSLQRYQGKTLVVKYGGNAMTDASLQKGFAQDVVWLKALGFQLVVVHGGGPQIEAALGKVGKVGQFVQGMRVTDAETMQVVQWVLIGQVQQEIVGAIQLAGGRAIGLSGRDGGLLRARPLRLVDIHDPALTHDVGQVGQIEAVAPQVIHDALAAGYIPVVSPVGFGEGNVSYNINADVVAGALARSVDAARLLMMTNMSGVMDSQGQLLACLDPAQIQSMCADGSLSGGMLPKIDSALDAARQGVSEVKIIDGRVPHALLLDVLTDSGQGTLIRAQ